MELVGFLTALREDTWCSKMLPLSEDPPSPQNHLDIGQSCYSSTRVSAQVWPSQGEGFTSYLYQRQFWRLKEGIGKRRGGRQKWRRRKGDRREGRGREGERSGSGEEERRKNNPFLNLIWISTKIIYNIHLDAKMIQCTNQEAYHILSIKWRTSYNHLKGWKNTNFQNSASKSMGLKI